MRPYDHRDLDRHYVSHQQKFVLRKDLDCERHLQGVRTNCGATVLQWLRATGAEMFSCFACVRIVPIVCTEPLDCGKLRIVSFVAFPTHRFSLPSMAGTSMYNSKLHQIAGTPIASCHTPRRYLAFTTMAGTIRHLL